MNDITEKGDQNTSSFSRASSIVFYKTLAMLSIGYNKYMVEI